MSKISSKNLENRKSLGLLVLGLFSASACGVLGYFVGGSKLFWVFSGINVGLNLAMFRYAKEYTWYTTENLYQIQEGELIHDLDIHQIVQELLAHPTLLKLPKPSIWFQKEMHINAFAVGYNPENSAVTVTEGILKGASVIQERMIYVLSEKKNFTKEALYKLFCDETGWDKDSEEVKEFFNKYYKNPALAKNIAKNMIKAVLGHELGHVKNRDTRRGGYIYALTFFIDSLHKILMGYTKVDKECDKEKEEEKESGFIFSLTYWATRLVLKPMSTVVSLLVSQAQEYSADHVAHECHLNEELREAFLLLKYSYRIKSKMNEKNNANKYFSNNKRVLWCFNQISPKQGLSTEHNFNKKQADANDLFDVLALVTIGTHPPVDDRIANLKALKKNKI